MADRDDDLRLVDPDLLPPQLRQLARLIGLPETLALLKARGGLPTYVPVEPTNNSQLRTVLSADALVALAREFGGQTLDLPKPDKVLAQLRNLYIVAASRAGTKTGRELAAELGLTWRMIKKIKAAARDDDRTGDLFGLDTDVRHRQA